MLQTVAVVVQTYLRLLNAPFIWSTVGFWTVWINRAGPASEIILGQPGTSGGTFGGISLAIGTTDPVELRRATTWQAGQTVPFIMLLCCFYTVARAAEDLAEEA